MYQVSEAFNTAAKANTRQILVKALFNNSTELSDENIIDMTVTEAINASGGLSMGATISSKLTMTLKMPDSPLILNNGLINPSIGFITSGAIKLSDGTLIPSPLPSIDAEGVLTFQTTPTLTDDGVLALESSEYCPLGKFYITQATSKNDFSSIFNVVAYDGFCKTEETYTPTISMPNTAEAILMDIANQCNFAISDSLVYPEGEFDLHEWTCRNYIGYFAGLTGKNARFNRDGYLEFIWYTNNNYSINKDTQYMSGLKRLTTAPITIQSITSGSSNNQLTSGTGIGISFENPLMTQEILDSIFESIGTVSYMPAQLKWRGNPAVESGDIITAEDKNGDFHTLYVMEQILKIGGGLQSEIKCYGTSEAEIKFETSPQSKKLQQVYTTLQEAIKAATELLNGANGGVFEITDEDGDKINDGWIIHTVDGQKFIKATINGIGITTDGGATYQQAMTADGINATAITTGQMNARRITVGESSLGDVFEVTLDDEGHPIIIIGSSANDIKQKQTNSAIEFVDGANETLAKFSVAGAEWADMQQIKYCGFVWTKSSSTGNVRFTKVGGE